MGRAIFISYRRDDTEGEAGRLFDDLIRAFGDNCVFMDVAGINPGMDFRKAIDDNVSGCGVLLAMIGPTWATITNSDGGRRLEDPNDFVRLEIASALGRSIAVIPVLVHDAKMPHPEQLPDNLKDLAFRNSVEITHARWNSDVQLLIGALGQYVTATGRQSEEPVHATVAVQLPPANPPAQTTPAKGKSKMKLILGIGAAVVVAIIAIAVMASGNSSSSTSGTSGPASTGEDPTTASTPATETTMPDKTAAQPAEQDAGNPAPSPLVGTWTNPAPLTDNGLKTLIISEANGQFAIQAVGDCGGNDCGWGVRTPEENGGELMAVWAWPQYGRVARITVRPEGSVLSVLIENTYSNHAPVSHQFEFDRAQ